MIIKRVSILKPGLSSLHANSEIKFIGKAALTDKVKGSSKGRHSLKTITAIKKVKKSVLRYL